MLWMLLTAALSIWIAGCGARRDMDAVVEVTVTSDSGPILPELQWHERIIITADGATLSRNGRVSDTAVNAGTWEIAVDAEATRALFAQLAAVDCTAIRRVEPDDPPDGGGAVRYEIGRASGARCILAYDPGVTYTGGDRIATPVQAFVRDLALPEAAARYRIADSP
jgi:hypothetical protein